MGPRGRGYAQGPLDKGTLRRAFKYVFADYSLPLLVVAVLIGVGAWTHLQGTLFMQKLIDVYILPLMGQTDPSFRPLAGALGTLAVIYLAGIAATYLRSIIMAVVAQGSLEKMRNELFRKMQTLPIRYFDTHERGNIMSVFTNDIDTMRQVIGQTLPQVLDSGITIVLTLVSMIRLSIPLTLFSFLMVGVQLFASGKLGGLSRKYFFQRQTDLGRENSFVEEMLEGMKVVKVFCFEEKSIEGFEERNEALRQSAAKAEIYSSVLMPVNANIGNIGYVLMAVLGAALVISGRAGALTLGMLITFLNLNRNFSRPVTMVSQQVNAIAMAMAGAARIFHMMDEESEADEGYVELVNVTEGADGTLTETREHTGRWAWKHPHHDGTLTYVPMRGQVTLDDVTFSYDGVKVVLHDVSLYGNPGEKIAFVGSTGAGKTTITNLLNRFYDIAEGKIRYDGINIQKIKKPALRSALGMVLQDSQLFSGTIMENIRYGRLDATDEECIAAAKLANADAFIRRLPDGYDTEISGNGAQLSQGERQMLCIARAAVADPPVMILDEATSSIDTRTESQVQTAMDALMHGRTTFVIAHRLSTVRNSDCIMVMEGGRIIERGNHDQLIAKKGKYYQLYTGRNTEETA
ncbi:MAG: ABC transporter ATP-binding protein [Oscillospiraceae bacterium]|nr:ABC transporter ATP-binding protein [Oscillospiraceae bacterium]